MTVPTDAIYAAELDAQDPLAHFRQRFAIPDPDLIYMDGNSLGRLPRATSRASLGAMLEPSRNIPDRASRVLSRKHSNG